MRILRKRRRHSSGRNPRPLKESFFHSFAWLGTCTPSSGRSVHDLIESSSHCRLSQLDRFSFFALTERKILAESQSNHKFNRNTISIIKLFCFSHCFDLQIPKPPNVQRSEHRPFIAVGSQLVLESTHRWLSQSIAIRYLSTCSRAASINPFQKRHLYRLTDGSCNQSTSPTPSMVICSDYIDKY